MSTASWRVLTAEGAAPSGRYDVLSSVGGETSGELIGWAERLDDVVFADGVPYGLE
jgi:hypothetical protein